MNKELKVKREDTRRVGECNFCSHTDPHTVVNQVTSEGHGPQLSIRICDRHLKELNEKVNKNKRGT